MPQTPTIFQNQKNVQSKLLTIQDLLTSELLEDIEKTIVTENVTQSNFYNPRETYAREKFFMYYETYIIGRPTIILEYTKYKISLPWQCNSNIRVFQKVVDYLFKELDVKEELSQVPKEDKTDE